MSGVSFLSREILGLVEGGVLVLDRALDGDTALFSACRRFRYVLTRNLGGAGAPLVVVGLNPSTAGALEPDNTIRRIVAFARRWGCGSLVMLNVYAYSATDPRDLWRAVEHVGHLPGSIHGEHNNQILESGLIHAGTARGIALAAWGTHAKPCRVGYLDQMAARLGVSWQCLGYNANGSPKHPLYLSSATPLVPWPRPFKPEEPDAWADVHRIDTVTISEPIRGVVDGADGIANVTVQPVEVNADDPDRFAQGLVDAFAAACTCGSTSGLRGPHHRTGCPRASNGR